MPGCSCGWPPRAGTHRRSTEPGEFDLHRTDAERHLAFGKGLHYCLGANLGRLEAQIAVAELARRYPRLNLVPDQPLTFHPNISFRGPQTLRVLAAYRHQPGPQPGRPRPRRQPTP